MNASDSTPDNLPSSPDGEAPTLHVAQHGSVGEYLERPGDCLGPYRLMEQVGEGGFGTVWRAEQTKPVHREVALKVIEPGMDSREIIARFEGGAEGAAMPYVAFQVILSGVFVSRR